MTRGKVEPRRRLCKIHRQVWERGRDQEPRRRTVTGRSTDLQRDDYSVLYVSERYTDRDTSDLHTPQRRGTLVKSSSFLGGLVFEEKIKGEPT